MKKVMVVLSLLASFTALSQSHKYSFEDLVGSWRNKSGAGLDVVDSNTIYIVNGGHRKLAKATVSGFDKNPLSLTLSVKKTSRVVTLKSLLLFVNDDTLQWQVFDTDTKPVSLRSGRGNMLFLKKIEARSN